MELLRKWRWAVGLIVCIGVGAGADRAHSHEPPYKHVDCDAPFVTLHLTQTKPFHSETKDVYWDSITLTGQKNKLFGWIGIDWGDGKRVLKVPVDQYALLDHCFQ